MPSWGQQAAPTNFSLNLNRRLAMKRLVIFSLLAATLVYGACEFATEPSNAYMQGTHVLIIGLLTPDSLREHPQEIFVGQISPRLSSPRQFFPPLDIIPEDHEVYRTLNGVRKAFRGYISGRADAEVYILMPSGEKLALRHHRDGLYRDITGRLKVEHRKTYRLEVVLDGKTYTGETTVPGKFQVTNIRNGDVVVPKIDNAGTPVVEQFISRSEGAPFYRILFIRSNDPFREVPRAYFAAQNPLPATLAFYFTERGERRRPPIDTIIMRSAYLAMDSNYARIYELEDTTRQGLSPSYLFNIDEYWDDWYGQQKFRPIHERSNLRGEGRFGGVFGSYAQTRITYKAVRPDLVNRPQ